MKITELIKKKDMEVNLQNSESSGKSQTAEHRIKKTQV